MARIEYTKTDAIVTGTQQDDNIFALGFAGDNGTLAFTAGRNDTLFGLGGNDTLFAGDDQDRLFGGSGSDTLRGGRGNDKLFGGIGNDRLEGGDGDDLISAEVNFPDVVTGANFGTDTVIGGAGFDTINFQTAVVVLQTFANPQAVIEEAEQGVSVNLVNSFRPGIVGDFALLGEDDGSVIAFVTQERGRILDANGTGLLADIERFTLTSHGDFILDSGANRVIEGGGGNDFISGGGGADVIDGGSGIDTALYRSSSAGVSVSLLDFGNGGSGSFGDAEGDKLFDIENVHGSDHSDFMLGDANANILRGFGGNDTLLGGNGNDTLAGGEGNDTLRGGLGNDTIDGGAGSDTAQFIDWNGFTSGLLSSVSAKITLGEGLASGSAAVSRSNVLFSRFQPSTTELERDTLRGIENVIASDHAETITGNSADNRLEGRGGNDTIDGGRGADVLIGGDGIDTVVFTKSSAFENLRVVASLSEGVATVTRSVNFFRTSTTETDTLSGIENLTGNSGDDTLTGDGLANTLDGGAGNDTLAGLGGADKLIGGDGVDTADYSGAGANVTVDLRIGRGLEGDSLSDTYASIESVNGSAHDDVIVGTSGINTLKGGEGNDIIEGLSGGDILDGGEGIDTLSYFDFSAGVVVSLDGSLAAVGAPAGDTILNFENLHGSIDNDVLRGDGNDNFILGLGGDDMLSGGLGADTLAGNSGFDTADYRADGAVIIDLEASDAATGNFGSFGGAAAGDTLISIEAILGGEGDNTIKGDAFDNTFTTLGGDDTLFGRIGDDTLNSGAGNDTIQGNEGDDTIDAGGGRDTINGGIGIDTIVAGAGNDTITGGAGGDFLTGGAGLDTFVFTNGSGNDSILDFEDGRDTIRFNSGANSFADLTIAGNGTTDVTVIFGNNLLDITGAQAITLTAQDFLFF